MQPHKIICCFRKAASSLVSSPHSPFVSARKCLEWGMKILACPCSAERVFLQLQRALGPSEQGAQVRFPPQIAILTEKSINTHITFHSESFWLMRVTRRSLEKQNRPPVFNFYHNKQKSHTYTSQQGLRRKAVIYGRIIRKSKSFESSMSNMITTCVIKGIWHKNSRHKSNTEHVRGGLREEKKKNKKHAVEKHGVLKV